MFLNTKMSLWDNYCKETKSLYLSGQHIKEFSWKGCPKDLEILNLSYNELTSFSWEHCPEGLKRISLRRNKLCYFSWEGCPEGLELLYLSGNKSCYYSFETCPLNLRSTDDFSQETLEEYKKSNHYRLRAGKRNHLIVDMITSANLVYSDIPVLKKYACRDYYKIIEDFKSFSKN